VSTVGGISAVERRRGQAGGGQMHTRGAGHVKRCRCSERGVDSLSKEKESTHASGKARAFAGAAPHDSACGARAWLLPLPLPLLRQCLGQPTGTSARKSGSLCGEGAQGKVQAVGARYATVQRAGVLQGWAGGKGRGSRGRHVV
jgi:hypothetical protein